MKKTTMEPLRLINCASASSQIDRDKPPKASRKFWTIAEGIAAKVATDHSK
jgi:hypothetical protein